MPLGAFGRGGLSNEVAASGIGLSSAAGVGGIVVPVFNEGGRSHNEIKSCIPTNSSFLQFEER